MADLTFAFLSPDAAAGDDDSMFLVMLSRRPGVLATSRANTLPPPPLELVRFFLSSPATLDDDDVCTAATSGDVLLMGATLLFLLALRRAVTGVVDLAVGETPFLAPPFRSLARIDVVRSGGVGRPRSVVAALLRLKRIDAGIVCLP